MTADGTSEAFPRRQGFPRRWNPLLTVRMLQVVLWLLVVPGPLAAVLLATQVSANPRQPKTLAMQVFLFVAGPGFEPATFGL